LVSCKRAYIIINSCDDDSSSPTVARDAFACRIFGLKVHELLDSSGRVAWVIGGSRGLGLAMASALGEMGA
jgi:hypothetical protein